ncbi:MAG: hypothetical protein IPP83_00810 [Flavobacteriales bacterium]|nr:hypothetical protein [Flavobacteriales bacterium]
MAIDRVKLAALIGPLPLRHWEHMALEKLRAVKGVEWIGSIAVTDVRDAPRGGAMFDRYVVQAMQGFGALGEPENAQDLGPEFSVNDPISHQADVVLCVGGADGSTYRGRTGQEVWEFRNADNSSPRSVPTGMRESFLGWPTVHADLLESTSGGVLLNGCFRSRPEDPAACADQILESIMGWPAAVMQERIATGVSVPPPSEDELIAIPFPGFFTLLSHRFRKLLGSTGRGSSSPSIGEWNIGILHQPVHALLRENASMNVRWMPATSKGKARLEPFGYMDDEGELNVLYRKLTIEDGHSLISRVRPKPDNILKRSRTMLDIDGRHEYPFTLLIEGKVHVLQGSIDDDRIELYQLNTTNDGLEKGSTIAEFGVHAPTLFQFRHRWWLMGTEDADGDTDLVIHHSASPFGPFVQVGSGPVKWDVRSARPAGVPFEHEGALYRPALDASDPHASIVVLNRITRLDEHGFAEEEVQRIEGFRATSYGLGVRTVSGMGDVTLVDGLRSPVVSGKKANASRSKRRHSRKKDEGA